MYCLGLMSGTSMDAIDVALVRFDDQTFQVIEYSQYPIDDEIRQAVKKLTIKSDIGEISRLDALLGECFAHAAIVTIDKASMGADAVTAIGSHGQTILHLPESAPPRTLQIGDPNIIAWKTGITTVADFRRMDMAAGGQGAPLAPAFHARFFRTDKHDRVILNIGGMANITLLPARPDADVTGFDTGPGNGLMDDWNFKYNKSYMDKDSAWAKTGTVNKDLLTALLKDPYFSLSPPKSTGRDNFNLDWLTSNLDKYPDILPPSDVQATLLRLTIHSIADAIEKVMPEVDELYVCGGGAHNPALMEGLRLCLTDTAIDSTAVLGINPDAVEAVTFAWLARQRVEGKPGNLPSVTGANRAVMLGAVYKPADGQK